MRICSFNFAASRRHIQSQSNPFLIFLKIKILVASAHLPLSRSFITWRAQGYFEAGDWYTMTSPAFQVRLKSCALNHPDELCAPIVGVDLLDLCLLITLICRLAKRARTAIWPRAGGGGGEVGGAHYYLGQQEDGGQLEPHEHPNSFKTVFLLLRQRNNARGLNANYITETITPKNKRETRNALRTHSHRSQRTRKDQDANSSVAFFLLAADIFFTTKDAQRGPFNYDHHPIPSNSFCFGALFIICDLVLCWGGRLPSLGQLYQTENDD